MFSNDDNVTSAAHALSVPDDVDEKDKTKRNRNFDAG